MSPDELSAAVREVFAYAARYIAPLAGELSSSALLNRPDVTAVLAEALDRARQLTEDAVREAWAEAAGSQHEYLDWLVSDVARTYKALGVFHQAIHQAMRSAGAASVSFAVAGAGRQLALRSQLTVEVSRAAARTMREMAAGERDEQAGFTVWKQWLCSSDPPGPQTCHWCRLLHKVVIPLADDFPLGKPADLTGHGRLTHPPKRYRGVLPGPPLHPWCGCRIKILTELPVPVGDGSQGALAEPGPHQAAESGAQPPRHSPESALAAADIQALPEDRYRALVAFLKAARHELVQALAKLREVSS